MNVGDLVANEETCTKEFWIHFFENNDIPFPTSATYETFEEWKQEFIERNESMEKVCGTMSILDDGEEFKVSIDGDYTFSKALKLVDYCDIEVDNWIELCDNVDEDFYAKDIKTLIVEAIAITQSEDDDNWNVEFSINYGDEPAFCTFHVDDEQLYDFLFQCYHKNIIR